MEFLLLSLILMEKTAFLHMPFARKWSSANATMSYGKSLKGEYKVHTKVESCLQRIPRKLWHKLFSLFCAIFRGT